MLTDATPQDDSAGPNVATLSLTQAAELLRVHPATGASHTVTGWGDRRHGYLIRSV
jgi:hypothetical protein